MRKKSTCQVYDERAILFSVDRGDASFFPEIELIDHALQKPVVSCMEAAREKGIPLKNELKTLILKTCLGFIALQTPGNTKVSLRKVKNILNVTQACLASPEELELLGLETGRISAVQNPTWSMLHLVNDPLLALEYISTNNGSKKGFYLFPPTIFLKAQSVIFGDFGQEEYPIQKVLR